MCVHRHQTSSCWSATLQAGLPRLTSGVCCSNAWVVVKRHGIERGGGLLSLLDSEKRVAGGRGFAVTGCVSIPVVGSTQVAKHRRNDGVLKEAAVQAAREGLTRRKVERQTSEPNEIRTPRIRREGRVKTDLIHATVAVQSMVHACGCCVASPYTLNCVNKILASLTTHVFSLTLSLSSRFFYIKDYAPGERARNGRKKIGSKKEEKKLAIQFF